MSEQTAEISGTVFICTTRRKVILTPAFAYFAYYLHAKEVDYSLLNTSWIDSPFLQFFKVEGWLPSLCLLNCRNRPWSTAGLFARASKGLAAASSDREPSFPYILLTMNFHQCQKVRTTAFAKVLEHFHCNEFRLLKAHCLNVQICNIVKRHDL